MKHLKSFNEDLSFLAEEQNLDIKYFENCFIDFIDLSSTYTEIIEERRLAKWHIQIFFPKFLNTIKDNSRYANYYIQDINDVVEHNDKIGEVYKDIDVSIKKVKLKYPNIKCNLKITWNNLSDFDYKTPASISIILF